jgi:MoxR-like ATPase
MKLSLGYPDRATEIDMLGEAIGSNREERVSQTPIVHPGQLEELQRHVASVEFHPKLREYLVDLGTATRKHPSVRLGLSPRGLLTWMRLAQARAHLSGRDFVIPDDVLDVAEPTLAVRLSGEFDDPAATIAEILSQVKVPTDA